MAGASALKWTTRTEALSQLGAGSSSRTWAAMERDRVGGGDRVLGAGRDGHIGVDDRAVRGAGGEDLDVVLPGRDLEVVGDRPEGHVGECVHDGVVEMDVDRGGIRRPVQDADHGRVSRGGGSREREREDSGRKDAEYWMDPSVHRCVSSGAWALVACALPASGVEWMCTLCLGWSPLYGRCRTLVKCLRRVTLRKPCTPSSKPPPEAG